MLESDMVQITGAFGSLTAELQTKCGKHRPSGKQNEPG